MIDKGQAARGRLRSTCIELAGVNSRKLMTRITRTETKAKALLGISLQMS